MKSSSEITFVAVYDCTGVSTENYQVGKMHLAKQLKNIWKHCEELVIHVCLSYQGHVH